jgi:hypothetical protein
VTALAQGPRASRIGKRPKVVVTKGEALRTRSGQPGLQIGVPAMGAKGGFAGVEILGRRSLSPGGQGNLLINVGQRVRDDLKAKKGVLPPKNTLAIRSVKTPNDWLSYSVCVTCIRYIGRLAQKSFTWSSRAR